MESLAYIYVLALLILVIECAGLALGLWIFQRSTAAAGASLVISLSNAIFAFGVLTFDLYFIQVNLVDISVAGAHRTVHLGCLAVG